MYNTYLGTVALESLLVFAGACGPWEVYDGAFSAAGRIRVNESAAVRTRAATTPSDLQRHRGRQI